jgi:glycosyltransferase involved in cell wall biosynthesis
MKKYIDKYITPSENLNDYLKKYDYNATTINNPLDIDSFDKLNYKIKKTNNYIYVGGINHNKGIFKFIDAFNDFSKDKNVKLTIVGKPTTSEDEIKLHNLIDNNKKIEFLGFVKNDKVKELLKEYGFIIVPSLWIENYPTTVLEGMASKRVVIGSNRGGIPKMIDNNKGIMFDIMNKNDIVNKLNYSYNLSDNEYEKIVLNAYDYLKHNNSFETYSNKINEYIEKIKRSDLL